MSVAIADYIKGRKDHNKLEAAENARVVLNEFRELLPTVKTVRGISKEHLTQFSMRLREKGLSDRTVSNKYNRLRSFLKFAEHDVKLSKDDRSKYEKTLHTIYTKAESDALLKHADDYMRVAISMGLYLGLREQELMHASFNDVNKDDRMFRVKSKPAYGFKVKDSEQHDVPVSSALFTLLDEWQQTRPQTELILGIDDEHTRPNGHLLRWQSMRAYRMQRCTRMRRTYVTTLVESGKMGLPAAMAFAGIVI